LCSYDVHASETKQQNKNNPLLLREFNLPEVRNWYESQDQVGQQSNGRGGVEKIDKGNAFSSLDRKVPGCLNGTALEDDNKCGAYAQPSYNHCSNEHHHPEDSVGDNPDVRRDDGKFRESNGGGVEDVSYE
jgi:hypothetical protein